MLLSILSYVCTNLGAVPKIIIRNGYLYSYFTDEWVLQMNGDGYLIVKQPKTDLLYGPRFFLPSVSGTITLSTSLLASAIALDGTLADRSPFASGRPSLRAKYRCRDVSFLREKC